MRKLNFPRRFTIYQFYSPSLEATDGQVELVNSETKMKPASFCSKFNTTSSDDVRFSLDCPCLREPHRQNGDYGVDYES